MSEAIPINRGSGSGSGHHSRKQSSSSNSMKQSPPSSLGKSGNNALLLSAASPGTGSEPIEMKAGVKTNRKPTPEELKILQEQKRVAKQMKQTGKSGDTGSVITDSAHSKSGSLPKSQPQFGTNNSSSGKKGSQPPTPTHMSSSSSTAVSSSSVPTTTTSILLMQPPVLPIQKQVALFSHLPQFRKHSSISLHVGFSPADALRIHPSIHSLGLKYSDGVIRGSTSRTVAMLQAFSEFVNDYRVPPNKALSWDLDRALKSQIQHLIDCRPHSIAMGNAIRYFRNVLTHISPDLTESEAKVELQQALEDFYRIQIIGAQEHIIKRSFDRIYDGDVIMTYARSDIVEKVLLSAHANGKRFQVVVVDSRPTNEAIVLLKNLTDAGIECVFIPMSCISFNVGSITKLFLGAGGILSNGGVLARAGTASVALMANTFQKPVYVFAETFKFSGRIQLDSFTYNELADPNALVLEDAWDGSNQTSDPIKGWLENPNLRLLNLVYDLTPANLVRCIVTEVGLIPPSSVPVIVREKRDMDDYKTSN